MRKKIIAGNWKMNLNLAEAEDLVKGVASGLQTRNISENLKVIIAPSHPYLFTVNTFIPGSQSHFFHLSAQDCSINKSGAFTGDVAASMLKNVGCDFTLVGHSERRKYQKESNEELVEKVKQAFDNNLKVIFCCGETIEERKAEKHFEVIENQLETVFSELEGNLENFVIAYEPVWAIGTGETATPQQAQEVHKFIRGLLSNKFGNKVAEEMSILYGGSCKPTNASDLFAQADIDGGLIGGASLKAESFLGIIDAMLNEIA